MPAIILILRRLGVEDDAAPEYLARPGFVGRERELSALRAALGEARFGQAVAVLVEGESGMGKTALLRRFLDELRSAVVLYGRCYERESVPYKAVDEVVDALCQHLVKLPAREVAALLPPDAGLLGVAELGVAELRVDARAAPAARRAGPPGDRRRRSPVGRSRRRGPPGRDPPAAARAGAAPRGHRAHRPGQLRAPARARAPPAGHAAVL